VNGSAPGAWRRLDPGDGGILKAFLLRHEDYAAGFTGRILRDGELRVPGFASGAVFGMEEEDGLRGAVLWSRSGAAFPIFEEPFSFEEGARLGRFFQGGGLASIQGASFHVDALEDVLAAAPRVSVAYRSLYRPLAARRTGPEAAAPEPDATVRYAAIEDAARLFPLHGAYEQEEVVTEIHRFDAAVSRASLNRILQSEIVAAAEWEGRIVATARTNAKGFRTWQIGGVYVVPELRGRGWGRYVVGHLLAAISREGKAAGLFVKERNAPARGLYRSMGFEDVGPYRVDYL